MLKVMLVDDKAAIVEGLEYLIDWNELGYEVAAKVTSANAALDLAKKNEYDLVVTDIRMPGMDGLELIEQLMQCVPKTKYILLSAYSKFEYAKYAIDKRISGYVLKPVNENELTALLKQVKSEIEKERKYEQLVSQQNKVNDDAEQQSEAVQAGHWGLVGKIIEYVENHYSDSDLNLNYLAQIFHVTPSYLGRVFKNKQGESFSNYLLNLRINKAKHLLKTTEYPIYEIASQVGFADANYFCLKFQIVAGMSATRYRKQGQ